jgi:hypothetical protein
MGIGSKLCLLWRDTSKSPGGAHGAACKKGRDNRRRRESKLSLFLDDFEIAAEQHN